MLLTGIHPEGSNGSPPQRTEDRVFNLQVTTTSYGVIEAAPPLANGAVTLRPETPDTLVRACAKQTSAWQGSCGSGKATGGLETGQELWQRDRSNVSSCGVR